jgi:hypothetical protein
MNEEQVFQKTDKGREEIAKRTHRIDSRRRTVLIVVDGMSSAAAIAAKVSLIEDSLALMQSLWTEGFIEPVGEASASAPAPPDKGTSPDSLAHLKRIACTEIQRLMGPDGDSLALKVERAATREEFLAEARKVHGALTAFLGPRKAEVFARSIGL